jgi:MFS family permease
MKPFFGWYVVAACFCMALFAWGFGFYGHSLYLAELQRSRGWSASLISSATTLYYFAGAGLLAGLDRVMARVGARTVVLGGTAALAASTAVLPLVTTPWQLYGAYLVMAFGWAGLTSAAISTILARWFDRRRGLAISLALNGASSGGIVIVPALVALTARFGFAEAVLAMVAAMIAVLVPLALFVLKPGPEALGLGRDGTSEPAPTGAPSSGASPAQGLWRSLRFWSIAGPFALALLAQVGFIIHQIPFLEPSIGRGGAGLAVALMTAAAVAGRVGLGFFIDRLDQRRVTALCLLSQAASLALMIFAREPVLLYAGSVVFGLSVGNLITLPALIVQREFPSDLFGAAVGLAMAVGQLTYAMGPALLGLVRDASGSYGAALALCIALQISAAATILPRPAK